ncbi:MAG: response regulator [Nitrospirales bacterium]
MTQQEGTILLADDEETFAKATQTLLQDQGFECHTVGNAKELSLALEGNNYDLLITDLKMPGNRVMEMVNEIHARSKILPVIVVTGYPSISSAVDSVRLNVLEYMVKPIEFPHLLKCVQKGIQFKQQMQASRTVSALTQQRLEQLENVENALQNLGNSGLAQSSETITTSPTLANLQTQLQEVVEHLKAKSAITPHPQAESPSEPILSDYFQLREGIYEAIQVLQLTKGSFRSKELASLRLKLQDLLKNTNPHP